jgi:hypothetical protein
MDPIDRPDFTGQWTLNLTASTLSPGAEQLRAPDRQHDNVWVFDRH